MDSINDFDDLSKLVVNQSTKLYSSFGNFEDSLKTSVYLSPKFFQKSPD